MPLSKGSRGAALKGRSQREAAERRLKAQAAGAAKNASAPDTFENRGALRALDAAKKAQATKAASTAPKKSYPNPAAIQRRLTSGPEMKVSEYDKKKAYQIKGLKATRR